MLKFIITPASQPVIQAEVLEYIKTHRPAFPRNMCFSRGPKKLSIFYMRVFHEVLRNNSGMIKTSWYQVGDGTGNPSQQLGYSWVGGNMEGRVY